MKPSVLAAIALLLLAGLTSCSSAPESPREAIEKYVYELNDGNVEKALSMVYDTRGISADDVLVATDNVLPEPLLQSESEAPANSDIYTALFAIGDYEQVPIDFVRTNQGWKIRYPEFIVRLYLSGEGVSQLDGPAEGLPWSQQHADAGITWTFEDQASPVTEDFVVAFGVQEFTFVASMPSTRISSAGTMEYRYEATVIGQERSLKLKAQDRLNGLEIKPKIYEEMKPIWLEEMGYSVLEWPSSKDCIAYPSTVEGEIARAECDGIEVAPSGEDCETWRAKPALGCDAYREAAAQPKSMTIILDNKDNLSLGM